MACSCETIATNRCKRVKSRPRTQTAKSSHQILYYSPAPTSIANPYQELPARQNRPKSQPKFGLKEYKDYLNRLECCKNQNFKLRFRCPHLDLCHLEDKLVNLEKTVYEVVYYPEKYRTLTTKEPGFQGLLYDAANRGLYENTYRDFQYRIEQLFCLKDALFCLAHNHQREPKSTESRVPPRNCRTGATRYDYMGRPAYVEAQSKQSYFAPRERFTLEDLKL